MCRDFDFIKCNTTMSMYHYTAGSVINHFGLAFDPSVKCSICNLTSTNACPGENFYQAFMGSFDLSAISVCWLSMSQCITVMDYNFKCWKTSTIKEFS